MRCPLTSEYIKHPLAMLLVIFTALLSFAHSKVVAPFIAAKDPTLVIPGKYIVVLNPASEGSNDGDADTMSTNAIDQHHFWLMALAKDLSDEEVKVENRFDVNNVHGYSGSFSEEAVKMIRERPDVKYVEPDQLVYTLDMVDGKSRREMVRQFLMKAQLQVEFENGMTKDKNKKFYGKMAANNVMNQANAPWGLSRVSNAERPEDLTQYRYPRSSGDGVDVYVIDTGINVKHVDFGGRAKWGATIPEGDLDIDGNGHGTHCAGTIAGKTFGIAKKAHVIAVKVLRTNGFGTNSDVIKGVEWTIKAAERARKEKGRKAAANMSLGGGRSITLEHIVDLAVRSGVHFAVAAGNDNEDACDYSPAAAKGPITVGATTNLDRMAFFSNHGPCVDIFAPGMEITSTWIGSRYARNTISGTSMASPHVAGVLALYLGEQDYEPKELKELLVEHANAGMLDDLPEATENRLLTTNKLLNLLE